MLLFDYFGAQRVPQREEHESERAFERQCAVALVLVIWAVGFGNDESMSTPRRLMFGFLIVYGLASYLYQRRLRRLPGSAVGMQYLFLMADPVVLVGLLVEDPQIFAFANSLVMVTIIRCGLRYGIRTLWLCWSVAVAAAALLLPLSAYWIADDELTLSLVLTLAFVPLFFLTLVRRIHKSRAVEEERAHVGAMKEVVSARNSFLAKVSHELRSPLQSIVSALDVFEMRHGRGATEDDELIGRMRRSSMLLNTQLRDLLTLARGQAGRLELHPEPFEACGLVEGVAIAARQAARDKGLDLQVVLPPEAVFVVADAARIDQVLTNIVTNSVRYTDAGSVRVELHRYDAESKRLAFTLSDTGPGIPDAMLPALFEPDKLFSGGGKKGEGTGIGLAVVRTLLDHLGGTVAVDSREGRGTTFEIAIPAERIDSDAPLPAADEDSSRILIVDDREDVLTGLASVIDELGFECDRATTAATAANLMAARRYHAVLLDIEMPVKSGAELAAEVRCGNGPNRQTRLLGMSAAEVADRYAEGPFDACLPKPIDRTALQSVLRDEWPETWPPSTI